MDMADSLRPKASDREFLAAATGCTGGSDGDGRRGWSRGAWRCWHPTCCRRRTARALEQYLSEKVFGGEVLEA